MIVGEEDQYRNKNSNWMDGFEKKWMEQASYIDDDGSVSIAATNKKRRHREPMDDMHHEIAASPRGGGGGVVGGRDDYMSSGGYGYGAGTIDISGALPTKTDPKLWLVPCLVGRERKAIQQLLDNYFKYKYHPNKRLFITSAFTTDQNTGHIYVEAPKEAHVRTVKIFTENSVCVFFFKNTAIKDVFVCLCKWVCCTLPQFVCVLTFSKTRNEKKMCVCITIVL